MMRVRCTVQFYCGRRGDSALGVSPSQFPSAVSWSFDLRDCDRARSVCQKSHLVCSAFDGRGDDRVFHVVETKETGNIRSFSKLFINPRT